jgi:Zn-dependent peptidase ImmA (M78 family)
MKFKLAGCTWAVVDTEMPDLGSTNPDTCRILINKKLTGQDRDVTFYHELVHAIMFTMGERDHDERFVEGFAQLLHQYEQQKV